MKVTYYLEVISSWCHWVEPVWSELKTRYAGRVEFDWKIALMNPADYPTSRTQCDWFYRRSGGAVMRSPYMLNSAWLDAGRRGHYPAPNLVAEAARVMGVTGDSVRLAIALGALRDGRKVGDFAESVEIAAKAGKLNPKKLRALAQSAEVAARVDASTAEFHAHQLSQRPAFILQDAIGDKAVFSGLVRIEPLAATIEAMLADTAAYASHAAHAAPMPKS
jgi:predicted DsbA family dithiol-disulfide isomerase